jgi:glycosyltransferase involved in cell wall biosynthesis
MRILHVSTRLILGGSQENTVLSCEEQVRRGHEVYLAFGPIYGPEGSLLARVEGFRDGARGISTHVVPGLVRAVHPVNDVRAYVGLRRLIRGLNPDVVHTHSSKAGVVGRAAAWAEGGCAGRLGVVHTIHGPPFFPGQNGAVRRLYILSERFAAGRCHKIISVADAMTRQYLAEGIGAPGMYSTVRSGMETERFLNPEAGQERETVRRGLGVLPDEVVVATVARLAEQKGHDDVLEALGPALAAGAGGLPIRLLWVGDGWKRGALLARARGLGLRVLEADRVPLAGGTGEAGAGARPHLIVTGLVPPERVPGLMRAADVLAHPSFREGLPRTVPQALLCGTAVVAYDCDGTGEACIDGVTGLLVRTGDRTALRHAVLTLAADAALRSRLATAGREMCAQAFTVKAMVDGLDGVYGRALAAAGRG